MAELLRLSLVFWSALFLGVAIAGGQPFPTTYHVAATGTTNSSSTATPPINSANDNFAPPALLIGVLIVLLVVLLVIAVGVVLALCIIGLVVILVFCGILSTSLLIGAKDRKVESAARALFVQLAAVAGMVIGCVAFWLAASRLHLGWSWRPIVLDGLFFGLMAGIALGLILNWIWRRIRNWILARNAPGLPVVMPSKSKR